jgi:general secretion pathway protein K
VKPARKGESGAALLTVLMLVAVIGVIAASSLERLKLQTRLAINMAAIDQARHFAYAGEAITVSRIGQIIDRNRAVTVSGDWLERPLPFPIDGGTAVARVSDGGNCFNLNSLVARTADGAFVIRPLSMQQFENLMLLVGVERRAAATIAVATADWIDSDSIPQPGGAEDGTYARAPNPYRAANVLMADVTELKSVAGVSPEIFERLRPWLCALPQAEPSPINLNTIRRDQAPLIAMLLPGTLPVGLVQRMIDERPEGGYSAAEVFWSKPALRGFAAPLEVQAQTHVKTRWFVLRMQIDMGGAELTEMALIDAGLGRPRVVRRSWDDAA